ncbi:MAG TPA: histidinol-phosphate transaminase [Candidatus Fournierella merdigallinarum]|nr:histidinol-phosphate transaminase [Candidatus Fournierella merdigallinarum]
MSRFLNPRYRSLDAYTPGEQPREMDYVKLNTNESPFPPAPAVAAAAAAEARRLHLYPDPDCAALRAALAKRYGLGPENAFVGNGSDEVLNFAFMAFCERAVAFPDISYGFYPVYAALCGLAVRQVPLREDFSLRVEDYFGLDMPVVLANPNAPTGMALPPADIRRLLEQDPGHVMVVDEAYVDFGAESCAPLVKGYDNLLVVMTFSKSRSLAGGRLGFALGSPALIADLERLKFSTNPYSINRMTLAAGLASLENEAYYAENCRRIAENRAYTADQLARRGFETLPSRANFLFTRRPGTAGEALYRALKQRGVLVRHWQTPRLADYIRVTIGSREQMDVFLATLDAIEEER